MERLRQNLVSMLMHSGAGFSILAGSPISAQKLSPHREGSELECDILIPATLKG